MKLLQLLVLSSALFLAGCAESQNADNVDEKNQAQTIVDKAIVAIGGDMLDNANVSFTFRTRIYEYNQTDGQFKYTRTHIDSSGIITVDVLANNGLTRSVDGSQIELDSKWAQRYSNSVNSVIYFAFLPYRLNDPAVIKTYNGLMEVNGKKYHEVEVQFAKEGGGVDHDDNFLYWFDEDNLALDYFAYDYITDEGGVRFRQAINRRKVDGLTVQDYINFEPTDKSTDLYGMLEAFKQGELKELSRIELENVAVQDLSKKK